MISLLVAIANLKNSYIQLLKEPKKRSFEWSSYIEYFLKKKNMPFTVNEEVVPSKHKTTQPESDHDKMVVIS
jgi:hypothetical protein